MRFLRDFFKKQSTLSFMINALIPVMRVARKVHFFRKKSVCFIGSNYYSFYYLAEALRKRGFKACSFSNKNHIQFSPFAHSTVSQDAFEQFKHMLQIVLHFDMVQFYGSFAMIQSDLAVLEAYFYKACGLKIGYTSTGCMDGSLQSEVYNISRGLCNKCMWQNRPEVCSDHSNKSKIEQIKQCCDLYSFEVDWPTPLRQTSIGFPLPLTSNIHSPSYNPFSISIPDKYKINSENKLMIFTAFGNENIRANEERDIKGKKFIKTAIDKLIAEGYPIKHVHTSDTPSQDMKYLQVQADIIVDQLNYGSIGAFAREGMMLGKPVICHIAEKIRSYTDAMRDCPAIDATEKTIYEVLKKVVEMTKEERAEIGQSSRDWMLKWYDSDVCAARFEKVYDRIMKGLPPYDKAESY